MRVSAVRLATMNMPVTASQAARPRASTVTSATRTRIVRLGKTNSSTAAQAHSSGSMMKTEP
jgi:hypothetical protein